MLATGARWALNAVFTYGRVSESIPDIVAPLLRFSPHREGGVLSDSPVEGARVAALFFSYGYRKAAG